MDGMAKRLIAELKKKAKYVLSRRKFHAFESRIHPSTLRLHDEVTRWATACACTEKNSTESLESLEAYQRCDDPLVLQGHRLAEQAKKVFKGKLSSLSGTRILAHLPSPKNSPAGFSLITNLLQSLNYIGVEAEAWCQEDDIEAALNRFKPSIFIISDYAPFLNQVDWDVMRRFRLNHNLKLGLTASLEQYGNTPLRQRLAWAESHGVDFYYSYRSPEYVEMRSEYKPFIESGYPILCVEFGVNPLHYYPVPGIRKDLNYVFLASSNQDKWDRYFAFLGDVLASCPGYISGPGWSFAKEFTFQTDRDRYLYARAKVGLNLHITEQIEWACELNERTYMLAACGVPQLVDNPALLSKRFNPDGFFIVDTPARYKELFGEMVHGSVDVVKAALLSQKETLENHTTFHRAETFAFSLDKLIQETRG